MEVMVKQLCTVAFPIMTNRWLCLVRVGWLMKEVGGQSQQNAVHSSYVEEDSVSSVVSKRKKNLLSH